MNKVLQIFILLSSLIYATEKAHAVELKEMSFLNQDNQPTDLTKWSGKFLVLSFIYSRCPMSEMCPLTISIDKKIYDKWVKAKKPFPLHFVVATLDPEEDGPEELKEYAKAYKTPSDGFTFLTGTKSNMADLSSFFDAAPIPGESMKSHKILTVLLGPNLEVIAKYTGNKHSYEKIASATRSFLKASSTKKQP
jgi:protein SCO1/2